MYVLQQYNSTDKKLPKLKKKKKTCMYGYVFVFVQTPWILLVNYHTRAWLQEKWEHPKKNLSLCFLQSTRY